PRIPGWPCNARGESRPGQKDRPILRGPAATYDTVSNPTRTVGQASCFYSGFPRQQPDPPKAMSPSRLLAIAMTRCPSILLPCPPLRTPLIAHSCRVVTCGGL